MPTVSVQNLLARVNLPSPQVLDTGTMTANGSLPYKVASSAGGPQDFPFRSFILGRIPGRADTDPDLHCSTDPRLPIPSGPGRYSRLAEQFHVFAGALHRE